MEALAGERVEEPGRVADEQPAVARAGGHPAADRRRALEPIADPWRRPRHRVVVGGRDRGHHRAGDRGRALAPEPLAPAPARQHDPDVDPAARAPARARRSRRRTRSSARPGPGPAPDRRRGRSAPGDRRAAAGGRRPASRATTDRSPSAPTITRASTSRAVGQLRPTVADRAHADAFAHLGPGRPGALEQQRIEGATGRARRPRERAIRRRRTSGGSASRRRSRPASRGSGARPARGRRRPVRRAGAAATVAGDVNTPQARQRQAGARSRTSTSRPAPREADRRRRAGGPAPDDQHLPPLHRGSVAARPDGPAAWRLSERRSRPGGPRTRRPSRRARGRRPRRDRAAPAACTRGGRTAGRRGG